MGKLKYTTAELDAGQLGAMWQFIQMGRHEAFKQDVQALKANLDSIRQSLIQMTGGQRKNDPDHYINFTELGTIVNIIVCETLQLYLSGALDKLEAILADDTE